MNRRGACHGWRRLPRPGIMPLVRHREQVRPSVSASEPRYVGEVLKYGTRVLKMYPVPLPSEGSGAAWQAGVGVCRYHAAMPVGRSERR